MYMVTNSNVYSNNGLKYWGSLYLYTHTYSMYNILMCIVYTDYIYINLGMTYLNTHDVLCYVEYSAPVINPKELEYLHWLPILRKDSKHFWPLHLGIRGTSENTAQSSTG